MADDNNILGGGNNDNQDDLDAMLRALMAEDTEDDWQPDDNFVDFIEGKTEIEDEPEEEQKQEEEAVSSDDMSFDEPVQEEEKQKPTALSGILLRSKRRKFGKEKEEKEKEPKSKTTKIIYALSALAVVAVIAVGIVLLLDISSTEDEHAPYALHQPGGRFNNAAFSSVELFAVFGEEIIALNQVLLDDAATVFYFGGNLDLTRFMFGLQDFGGRIYERDITFAISPWRQRVLDRTEIRFEAMDRNAEGLTLFMTDLHSGYTASVDMTFDGDLIPVGRYINQPVSFTELPVTSLAVTLNYAQFSASGSIIDLAVFHGFTDGGIVFGGYNEANALSISHNGVFTPHVNGILQWTNFGDRGVMLARMDFGPLRHLSGEVEIFLDGLYRRYDINRTMLISPLLTPGAARTQVIDLDANHQLTIHGMMRQGDLFVMSLYGANQGERVATTIAAYIVGVDDDGNEQRLRANVRHGSIGADALFDLTQNMAIAQIPSARLHLEIQEVFVRLPQISQTIDLSQGDFWQSERRQDFENAIVNHFASASADRAATTIQVSNMHITGNNAHAIVIEQSNRITGGALHTTTLVHTAQGTVTNGIFTPINIQTAALE